MIIDGTLLILYPSCDTLLDLPQVLPQTVEVAACLSLSGISIHVSHPGFKCTASAPDPLSVRANY